MQGDLQKRLQIQRDDILSRLVVRDRHRLALKEARDTRAAELADKARRIEEARRSANLTPVGPCEVARLSSMAAIDLVELAGSIADAERASTGGSRCSPVDMHRLGFYFSRKILCQEATAVQRRQFARHGQSYFESASYRERSSTQRSGPRQFSASAFTQRILARDQRRVDLQRKKEQTVEAARARLAERDRLRAALAERIAAAQARREAGQQRAAIEVAAERDSATVVLEDAVPAVLEDAPAAGNLPSLDKPLQDLSPPRADSKARVGGWGVLFRKALALCVGGRK